MIYPWQLTVFENQGWLRGGPAQDGDARGLLNGLLRMGITKIAFDTTTDDVDFNMLGFAPIADELGMGIVAVPTQAPDSAYLLLHVPLPADIAPCQHLTSGYGVYAVRGVTTGLSADSLRNPQSPGQRYEFVCPAASRSPGQLGRDAGSLGAS